MPAFRHKPKSRPSFEERLETAEKRWRLLRSDKQEEAAARITAPYPQIATAVWRKAVGALVGRASKEMREQELRRIEKIIHEYTAT